MDTIECLDGFGSLYIVRMFAYDKESFSIVAYHKIAISYGEELCG